MLIRTLLVTSAFTCNLLVNAQTPAVGAATPAAPKQASPLVGPNLLKNPGAEAKEEGEKAVWAAPDQFKDKSYRMSQEAYGSTPGVFMKGWGEKNKHGANYFRFSAEERAEVVTLQRQDLDALLKGLELELDGPTGDDAAGADVGLADLGAVEERAVGRVQIPQQVPLRVANDLKVGAADGLLRQDQVVVVALTDPDHVAGDDELFAPLGAADDDQLALIQVNCGCGRLKASLRNLELVHVCTSEMLTG